MSISTAVRSAAIALGAGLAALCAIWLAGNSSGEAAPAQPAHVIVVPALARDGAIPSRPGDFTTGAQTTTGAAGTVTIAVSVTATYPEKMIVDVEVYAPGGGRVLQQAYHDQVFGAGQERTYQVQFTPASGSPQGTYVVKLGLFSPGWVDLYHWNDSAATFQVP